MSLIRIKCGSLVTQLPLSLPPQQRLVSERRNPAQSVPSLLHSFLLLWRSSYDGVCGNCSNPAVVVPVFGNLRVSLHAPFLTPAERRACSSLNRKNTEQQLHYNKFTEVSSQKTHVIERFRKDKQLVSWIPIVESHRTLKNTTEIGQDVFYLHVVQN